MKSIVPHLWFDTQAKEAVEFYVQLFDDSHINYMNRLENTPGGDSDLISFELAGQSFMAINAGPHFSFNPSISFMVLCHSNQEIKQVYNALISGGKALMPLDSYPFSDFFAWVEDRYGLTWQLAKQDTSISQKIVPFLLFSKDVSGKAEEAVRFYTSLFPRSSINDWQYDEKNAMPKIVEFTHFTLNSMEFMAMDDREADKFHFNEALSFIILCKDQKEVDYYWNKLSAVPEAEECGWLKDRYGVSWQVVPEKMYTYLNTGTQKQINQVTQAFLKMKKLDISELEKAWHQIDE